MRLTLGARALSGAAALVAVGSGVACHSQRAQAVDRAPGIDANEIRIGSAAALSGHASFLGTQLVHGSEAWFREVNARGGVNGRRIRLIVADDRYDPVQTTAATQRLLVDDDVFALFDYVGTPTSTRALPLFNRARVPVVGLFTGAESLRTPPSPWVFHVRDSYYAEAEAAVALFVDQIKARRVGVLYQQDAFGQAVLAGVQLALRRRSMQPAAAEGFVRGTLAVEGACEALKRAGAEAVVLVGTYAPLAKAIKVSHDAGFSPWFHTVSFVGSEAFAHELTATQKIDPSRYKRVIVTQVVPSPTAEDLPGVREYRILSAKYFPTDPPNYVALEGFINAKVLTAALERAGAAPDRDSLVRALEQTHDLDVGIGRPISFAATDHVGLEGVFYSRLAPDGVFRLLPKEEVSL